jgi:PKD repeat protein
LESFNFARNNLNTMRKIYLSILALCMAGTISAQRVAVKGDALQVNIEKSATRGVKDTTFYSQFAATWTPVIYTVNNGGFLFGSNGYGDLQKAQGVIPGEELHPGVNHKVDGVGFFMRKTGTGSASSKVTVKVYSYNMTTGMPGAVLAQKDISFANIINDGMNWVSFATPPTIGATQPYLVGFDVSGLQSGDHVGVFTSTADEVSMPEISYEQWDDATWYTVEGAWGIDLTAFTLVAYEEVTGGGTAPVANFSQTATTVCENGTITFNNTSTNATSYAWDFGAGATPQYATTAGPHTITYTTSGTKTVTLVAADATMQTNTKTSTVTVNAAPAAPTVTLNGNTLSATGSGTFQWYLDGSAISGATGATHTVTTNGSYTVTVTSTNSCTSTASQAVNTEVGIEKLAAANIRIYPNPTNGAITVNTGNLSGVSVVSVSNILGEVVAKEVTSNKVVTLNLDGQSNGVYFITIQNSDKNIVSKIIKR